MKEYTHICIVLDASGSMSPLESDTRGSFHHFLDKQREAGGKTVLDLYQFSDEVTRIVTSADLSGCKGDLLSKYSCSGCTALNDAVCIAIDTLGHELAAMKEAERPQHVFFVIITDGMENASVKYSSSDVKKRIRHQSEVYQWDFDFLAANQDAFATGETLGVCPDQCMNFTADSKGICGASEHLIQRAGEIRKRK